MAGQLLARFVSVDSGAPHNLTKPAARACAPADVQIVRPVLDAHMQRSPEAWRPDIYEPAYAVAAQRMMAQPAFNHVEELEKRVRCDGCGQTSLGLQRCSRCHQALFCGRACFRASWQRHKPACNAAVAAAAQQQEQGH